MSYSVHYIVGNAFITQCDLQASTFHEKLSPSTSLLHKIELPSMLRGKLFNSIQLRNGLVIMDSARLVCFFIAAH